MDIWIPVLVAVVTGLLSFIASTVKSHYDMQKVKLENKVQMQRMKEQHQVDLEKIEKEHIVALEKMKTEFELKLATYDSTKEADVKYSFMEKIIDQAIKDPANATKELQGLKELTNLAQQLNSQEK